MFALFMRVSTRNQSHDRQKTILNGWVKSQGISRSKVDFYRETVSGKAETKARQGLAKLLKDVEAGKIHTVVVERLDRLSRSTRKGLDLLARLAEKNVRVVSIQQNLDLSGAMGKLLSTLFLALAEWERDMISDRIKESLNTLKENGKKLGRPINNKRTNEILALKSQGASAVEIAEKLKISRQSVYYHFDKKVSA